MRGAGRDALAMLEIVIAWMLLLAPGRDHSALAGAIASAVEEADPLFVDDADKRKTASLVTAVAFRESSFRNDVVSKTGDHCALQVHGRPELGKDAAACVRVGLAMLRESMRVCPAHPLAFYAEGPRGCTSERAQRISRDRLWLARKLARTGAP